MATLKLYPVGAGNNTGLTPSTGANWSCVDEASANDADYVSKTDDVSISAYDLYTLTDPTGTIKAADIINSITLYMRAKYAESDEPATKNAYLRLRIATDHNKSTKTLTASYANYSDVWTTNPESSAAWTLANLVALQAGPQFYGVANSYTLHMYCSQFYVEVDYTPANYLGLVGDGLVGDSPLLGRGLVA
jgi:hypothetical protein